MKLRKKFNQEKGFTLIQLLAVIIILTIIVLIATTIILNVIDDEEYMLIQMKHGMIMMQKNGRMQ